MYPIRYISKKWFIDSYSFIANIALVRLINTLKTTFCQWVVYWLDDLANWQVSITQFIFTHLIEHGQSMLKLWKLWLCIHAPFNKKKINSNKSTELKINTHTHTSGIHTSTKDLDLSYSVCLLGNPFTFQLTSENPPIIVLTLSYFSFPFPAFPLVDIGR